MKQITRIALLVLALAVIIALVVKGCSDSKEPELSPSPEIGSTEPSAEPSAQVERETVFIGTVVDIDSSLNIRATPDTSGEVVGKAKNGDKFTVLEMNVGGADWHRVTYEGMVAYVSANYLVVDAVERDVVPTTAPDLTLPSPDDADPPDNDDADPPDNDDPEAPGLTDGNA